VAVNAHGYLRFTKDVHLVIRLSPRDIISAFHALEQIDYRPSNPISAEDFCGCREARWLAAREENARAEDVERRRS
jgi:hypothetical protein